MRKLSMNLHLHEDGVGLNWSLLGVFALAWAMTHPYFGVVHDGVLYLAQALRYNNPKIFDADLFFFYGSQDSYTVFPALYAALIRVCSTGEAALIATIISQTAFVLCLMVLCVRMFGAKYGILSACSVGLMSRYYGGYDVFSYSETFFTARSVAEPICLLAMSQLLVGRYISSLLALLVAALLHPLVALPCLLVWFLMRFRAYLYFICYLVPVFLAGLYFSQGHPFGQKILAVYDDQWWGVVRERDVFVFPAYWRMGDWVVIFVDVFLIYSAFFLSKQSVRIREFFRALLIAFAVMMTLSVLGSALLRSVLITSLQLWRVDWVLHLVAMACIPFLLCQVWGIGSFARPAFFYFVCSIFYYKSPAFILLFGFGALLVCVSKMNFFPTRVLGRILLIGAGSIFFVYVLGSVANWSLMLSGQYISRSMVFSDRVKLVLFDPSFVKILFLVVFCFVFFVNVKRFVFFSCVVMTSAFCFMGDRRGAIQIFIGGVDNSKQFDVGPLGVGSQIYWHNNPLGPWVLLGRPSFYTFTQGSGVLFSRGTALEFQNRRRVLGLENQFRFDGEGATSDTVDQVDPGAMVNACKKFPQLKALVVPKRVPNVKVKRYELPSQKGEEAEDLYVYQCADLVRM